MKVSENVNDNYDVIVIGGGAAGLNGALMLARSRRSTLVIDAGAPRNAPATGVHGLLARDGMSPSELLSIGRDEVRRYGGQVVDGEVTDAIRDDRGFVVSLADSRRVRAKRLLVATGLVDVLPDVAGLAEHWGHDVVHCPYCHGWEVRDTAIGVLASSERATHQALLFRQLSDDVIFFAHDSELTSEQVAELTARDIRVVWGTVTGVETADGRVSGVRLSDGTVIDRQTIAVQCTMVARTDFLAGLGLQPAEHPMGAGTYLPVDPTGQSSVPGVWVAGNATDLMAQVGASSAAGAMAGAVINADLIAEELRAAMDARARSAAHRRGELIAEPEVHRRCDAEAASGTVRPTRG
jgi:thioredoxin reductase